MTEGGVKKQVVGRAELLPCVFARRLWSEKLQGRPVMHFIDNDAARFSLIKGTSPTQDSAWLTGEFWRREAKAQAFSWFERVPSPSNPADGPSRLQAVSDLGANRRSCITSFRRNAITS